MTEQANFTTDQYRRAMGRFASGVTIASTLAGKQDHAMTANAVVSVSLEPTLLMISVGTESRWFEAAQESGVWGISLMPATGRKIAEWLATPGRPMLGQLGRVPHHRGVTGVALMDDALTTIECRTVALHEAGDHHLFIGEVIALEVPESAHAPLVHCQGSYRTLTTSPTDT
ncbi:flavin reductase family protein [Ornithinimicrobium sp. INDO-MA30-4]|uniref:flavin reductase family protein n=1 Tax=Ornithinimicrobium sp. INDO-MA30-4 TaxID=2908651 RepID=UPI001F242634|nr:flavin reductase family protein [Ornithinimicrobium sp. INDO-MA30-4]UJH69361.1 flavin reductase family protein [Ornithinimicrobium sp. INDO-MA30-4]